MTTAINISNQRCFFPPVRTPIYVRNAAGATSHPLATMEAVTILQRGGSAADAAIAACVVQCVVEPHMTGIGGDCFALIKTAEADPVALNGSGWTPRRLSLQRVQETGGLSLTSAHTVTVPGAIAAWRQLHERFGKLPWSQLFSAAINYAEDGFIVAPRVAQDWYQDTIKLQMNASTAAVFLPRGRAPAVGEVFRQPTLAKTLQVIADDGGESFYSGNIARDIITTVKARGGVHEIADFADFANYGVQWTSPIAGSYRGWRVWECPPNGQGVTALLMMAAMDGHLPLEPATAVHWHAEITRLAYTWRDKVLHEQLQQDWSAFFAQQGAFMREAVGENASGALSASDNAHQDTVYIAVADANGMMVSFINSLFNPFGSGILAPHSGVLLHNRGLSFSLQADHPNVIAPRKRPLHTIIPAIANNAEGDAMAFGVMGGHYQAAGQAWFLSRLLDYGDDPQAALDAPRFFNYPDMLQVEPHLPADVVNDLRRRGHRIAVCKMPLGGGQVVWRRADGVLVAASDCRKDGMAAGF